MSSQIRSTSLFKTQPAQPPPIQYSVYPAQQPPIQTFIQRPPPHTIQFSVQPTPQPPIQSAVQPVLQPPIQTPVHMNPNSVPQPQTVPHQSHPFRYWNLLKRIDGAQHFIVLQSTPIDGADVQDLDQALHYIVVDIVPTIVKLCDELKCLKIWPSLHVRYESANPLAEPFLYGDAHLRAPHSIFHRVSPNTERPYKHEIARFSEMMRTSNAKFIRDGSGFILAEIYSLNLNIVTFNPLSGSAWSELPKFLKNKKAIINVKNEDNMCFAYAIASALHPVEHGHHPSRPNQYQQYFAEHNLDQIDYPVNPTDLPEIEEQLQMSINVISYYDDIGRARYPLYISKRDYPTQIDLLYFNEHYAWIKNFSRLFADLTKHNASSILLQAVS